MFSLDLQQSCILPDWPAPKNIFACTTTRQGGVSSAPYQSLNLGLHVDDDEYNVLTNRLNITNAFQLRSKPVWLNQTHSTCVYEIKDSHSDLSPVDADASYTRELDQVSVVLTADCLPILLCDLAGTVVAAVHAGWRGLAAGIIENTVTAMQVETGQLMAWMGPAIGPDYFEVGVEVMDAFASQHTDARGAFTVSSKEKYLADLYYLARLRLKSLGISQIYGGEYCTYKDEDQFYSYRRDKITGRMATLISIVSEKS